MPLRYQRRALAFMRMRLMRALRSARTLFAVGSLLSALAAAAPNDGKLLTDVVFTHYSAYAGNAELARRLLSPATVAQIERQMAASGQKLTGQAIDLSAERFSVYVPNQAPAHGYGLLVFVPPWQQASLPQGWAPVLDQYGVIFVTAARSGNSENTMGRREPLALLAAYNVMAAYPIDADRVYIGGFSGGSRIAQRLAIGYPDLFRGAVLNAGSDALGDMTAEPPIPLPPRDLFMRFQSDTHLIYVTGEHDEDRVRQDRSSIHSMSEWCVFTTEGIVEPLLGHTVAQPAALARALAGLRAAPQPDAGKLSRCRADMDADLDAKLAKVESLIADGQRAAADKLLRKIDERYGGLAAPRSLKLAQH